MHLWCCFSAGGVSYFGIVFKFLVLFLWVQLNGGCFELSDILKWFLLPNLTLCSPFRLLPQRATRPHPKGRSILWKRKLTNALYIIYFLTNYCGFIAFTKNHLFIQYKISANGIYFKSVPFLYFLNIAWRMSLYPGN